MRCKTLFKQSSIECQSGGEWLKAGHIKVDIDHDDKLIGSQEADSRSHCGTCHAAAEQLRNFVTFFVKLGMSVGMNSKCACELSLEHSTA